MSLKVQEKEGNLICLNHNEKITMFIMDQQVPFKDTLLCQSCFEERNTVSNKIIALSKAKLMIQEQGIQNLNDTKYQLLNELQNFQNNLLEYQNVVTQNVNLIKGIIAQWITDYKVSMNLNTSKSLLLQLKELHENKQGSQNSGQTIDKINSAHVNKLSNNLKKLQNQEELVKLDQNLQSLIKLGNLPSISQNVGNQQNEVISQKQIIKKVQNQGQVPKKCELINSVEQKYYCEAIAFNQTGSLMVAGCHSDIKVWSFHKGQLKELNTLTGHVEAVTCLVFSKKLNWFVSGSDDSTIRGWKEQGKHWISTEPLKEHSSFLMCIILNTNEDELISCDMDKTIKVWQVDCTKNIILYHYTLENKHTNDVYAISLNTNETALVSCSGDQTIILWMKGQNQKWEYINHIKTGQGYRICFVNDTQFLFQSGYINQTQIFQIENKQIIEQKNLKILLNEPKTFDNLNFFPTIFNQQKQVIIQNYSQYVYIIQRQIDASYKIILKPIDCQCICNCGQLTNDGEYLVIWNDETKEFRVHQITY